MSKPIPEEKQCLSSSLDFRVARAVEHFHDLCMVRSSNEVEPSEMVHRRPSELGDSLVRIFPSGVGESNWPHLIQIVSERSGRLFQN